VYNIGRKRQASIILQVAQRTPADFQAEAKSGSRQQQQAVTKGEVLHALCTMLIKAKAKTEEEINSYNQ